jgi:hypothetical protein
MVKMWEQRIILALNLPPLPPLLPLLPLLGVGVAAVKRVKLLLAVVSTFAGIHLRCGECLHRWNIVPDAVDRGALGKGFPAG